MSNLSLQDQLKALSLGMSSAPETVQSGQEKQDKKKGKPHPFSNKNPNHKAQEKPGKQKPAWLEHARYGVELLKAYFPNCFRELKDIQPLKIGIKQDLVKHLSTREDIVLGDKACMVSSLSYYVNSASYHKVMLENALRIDLDGQPAGKVTAEESLYSAECRKVRLQKKQGNPASSHKPEGELVK